MVLRDKVALVTGAARGIGREIALNFARQGADVAVVDISLADAEAVASEIRNMGRRAVAVSGSVGNTEDVETFVGKISAELGRIDILVNNAGITRDTLLLRMKEEDWDTVLNVNLKGTFLCTRAVAKLMIKQKYGRIINIASVVALSGNAGQANYSASKAGIVGFTKTVARELASRNITVNAIAPGFIATNMTDVLPENIKKELMAQIPLGRLGSPEDIANTAAFLVSDAASYITGQTISVNGGMVMQ
jgi:3-oxoacyl-[acyl-carrier protein] reductase